MRKIRQRRPSKTPSRSTPRLRLRRSRQALRSRRHDGGGRSGNVGRAPANPPIAEASPLDGLKISSQSWRRGGLGSKALVTFTLRNANEYAVKDIEIACSFTRRDGRHLTDRKRLIGDTVEMKSRKTFAKMHVGFVNVNADKAKCALVTASRAHLRAKNPRKSPISPEKVSTPVEPRGAARD